MSNEPRYPLALTLAQLSELAPLLEAAAEREGDPDASVFALQDLVRAARRAARSDAPTAYLNAAQTLEDARLQVRAIDNAKDLAGVNFWWTWSAGYFMALLNAKLIDLATKQALDLEADAARDGWSAPGTTTA